MICIDRTIKTDILDACNECNKSMSNCALKLFIFTHSDYEVIVKNCKKRINKEEKDGN